MDFKVFKATKNDDGRRLDRIIRIFAGELPLSLVYKYIRKGLIKVNGKKVDKGSRVYEGDEIAIAGFILGSNKSGDNETFGKALTEDARKNSPQKNQAQGKNPAVGIAIATGPELKIVFENEHILILDKPYDLAVHASQDSLEKKVLEYYRSTRSDGSLSFRPGPLHRLDRKTTGLICFSMSLEGARWFSQSIRKHCVQKKYAAILEGRISGRRILENQIEKRPSERSGGFHTVSAVKSGENSDNSKNALTIVKPVAYGSLFGTELTLADIEIKSGRTHQIRAQTSLNGHPLLGDTAYGGKPLRTGRLGFEPQDFYLEAYCLRFPQNPVGLPPEVKIPLSDSFSKMLGICFGADDFAALLADAK